MLRLSNPAALPATSNLVIDEGQLELNAGNFTRGLGSGTNQVQWQGDGGFSAAGGTRGVNIGGSTPPATLTWGVTNDFIPAGNMLLLGAKSDTAALIFQNPLNLSSNGGSIQMADGAATVDAELTGSVSDSAGDATGLQIVGNGTLELAVSNSYAGPTWVSGPVLRLGNSAALPGASNLVLDGGILELAAGNFTRGIGTSSAQVQWTANGGGFSASGGSRAVNIGGSGATLTWGSGVFVPGGSPLMLGSPSDDSTLVFQNPINLGSSIQTIEVSHGSAAVDAILSGNLTGTGGLLVTGNGVLQLSGTNSFSGGLSVNGVALKTEIMNSLGLASGTSLIIGNDTAAFSSTTFAPLVPADAAAVAPEPGSISLVTCGTIILLGWIAARGKRELA